mmetsp:Transcript_51742/g.155282  ORF Transcript_51742/g.155282 Transcript_51742/m.155282 type:complete len:195 (-) Transcript_51742:66-650(-)
MKRYRIRRRSRTASVALIALNIVVLFLFPQPAKAFTLQSPPARFGIRWDAFVGESISTTGIRSSLTRMVIRPCFPKRLEDWSADHVHKWLDLLGYGRYADAFLLDGVGGVDGDRLVYLGTPDQLDHIEWHLGLLGVSAEDQIELSETIEMLVSEGIDSSMSSAGIDLNHNSETNLEEVFSVKPVHNYEANDYQI